MAAQRLLRSNERVIDPARCSCTVVRVTVRAGQSHIRIRVRRPDLGGFWAHVAIGLGEKTLKIIRKSIFLVSERLNDSRIIAKSSPSHFKRDDASLLDKSEVTC